MIIFSSCESVPVLRGNADALSLCGDFRILAEAIVRINPQWGNIWRDRRVVPHRLGCVTGRANVECLLPYPQNNEISALMF